MKKSKILLAVVASTMLAVGGGVLAGCNKTQHSHTYSDDWKSDATGHYHVATCDDLKEGDKDYKKDFAEHVWGDDDECDVCHYKKAPAPVTEYTVTLSVGEGTLPDGAPTTLTTVNGKLASLPTPTAPAGKTFDGWYTAATDGTKVTTDYTFTGETKTVTIYAVYVGETVTVTLNETELKLGIGNLEAELSATVSGGGTVTWESDNPEVVSVGEENGYVEALKPGAATITATVVGGEASATCEVVVADGYYLIGGMDSAWNKVGVFGQSGVIYFMPTETEGIYKTESTELPKLGNFQIAPVGDTSGDWYKKAFNGDYIATGDTVLSKNEGGNIAVEKHGKYTITLDLTGETAVVSGVCDQEIDDGDVEDIYYIIGSANATSGWTEINDAAVAGNYVFASNGDGTYGLTVELSKGTEFKVAIVGMAWNGALGESAIPRDLIGNNGSATVDTDYKLTWTSSDNIGVGLSGKYIFTLNPDGEANNKLSYTFEATEDTETGTEVTVLHYYIKGDALTVDNGWNVGALEAYELKETGENTGIYTLTIELKNSGGFMFWSSAEGKDGTVTGTQVDYFNNSNSTFTAEGDCVTATTNYAPTAAGWYTITLNPETKALTFSYSATAPEVTE